LIASEGREQGRRAGQFGELHGRDRPGTARLLPGLERVDDLAGTRHPLDTGKLHPLDVSDHRDPHRRILTPRPGRAFQDVDVALPPFERFYEQHRNEVFAFLVRRLGLERAEDAFQETFLRALRAYPKLRHGEHLRAWAFTIAS